MKAIIHAHKGEVVVDSENGVGTTFIVQIPLINVKGKSFAEDQAQSLRLIGMN